MAKIIQPDLTVTHAALSNANAALTEGLLYGVNSSGNLVVADSTTPVRAAGVAFRSLSAADAAAGKPGVLILRGIAEVAAADITGSWTVGNPVYLSSAGKYTTVKPTTNAHLLQCVGTAIRSDRVLFQISPVTLLVQTAGNSNVSSN